MEAKDPQANRSCAMSRWTRNLVFVHQLVDAKKTHATTTYVYDSSLPHYIKEVPDPRGVPVAATPSRMVSQDRTLENASQHSQHELIAGATSGAARLDIPDP
jgi:hypothetical protein